MLYFKSKSQECWLEIAIPSHIRSEISKVFFHIGYFRSIVKDNLYNKELPPFENLHNDCTLESVQLFVILFGEYFLQKFL